MNDLPERGRIGQRGITDTFTRLGVTNGKDILDAQIINMYDRSTQLQCRPVARLLSGEVLISHYRDHALFRDYTNAARGSGGTL